MGGQACASRSPVGLAQTPPFIHYLLGVAQTILFEQSVDGESRAHLGLCSLLCPCGVRFSSNFKDSPRVGPGMQAPGPLPAPPTPVPSPMHLLRWQPPSTALQRRQRNPESLLLCAEGEEETRSLLVVLEKSSPRC